MQIIFSTVSKWHVWKAYNGNHDSILESRYFLAVLGNRRQREPCRDCRFDGRGSAGNEVAQLVAGTNDKSSEATGGQFHEMDAKLRVRIGVNFATSNDGDSRNDSPGTLHAKLLEECRSHDGLAGREAVRIEQSSTDNGNHNDTEASSEHLRKISDRGAAGHRAKIGNHLQTKVRYVTCFDGGAMIGVLTCVTVTASALNLYWLLSIVG